MAIQVTFLCTPAGTAVPASSNLVPVRRTPVQTLQEVESVRLTDRRLWLRIINPKSQQRKLSVHSRRVQKLWLDWLKISPPLRSMRPALQVPICASADAPAQGDSFQVGGLIESESTIFWSAEKWTVLDVKSFDIPVRPDAQRDTACYETLAQGFLVLLCLAICPTTCVPLHSQSLSDNVAAEASGNKLFTTSAPLCYFVEHLASILVSERISCDISHIPGPLNQDADLLSRWDLESELSSRFAATHRHRMSLEGFFRFHRAVRVHPSSFPLQWPIGRA